MVSAKNVNLAFPWLSMFRELLIMLLSKNQPICSKLCNQNKDYAQDLIALLTV